MRRQSHAVAGHKRTYNAALCFVAYRIRIRRSEGWRRDDKKEALSRTWYPSNILGSSFPLVFVFSRLYYNNPQPYGKEDKGNERAAP
jgi:hypothetical protein